MTVAELIKELKGLPADAEVKFGIERTKGKTLLSPINQVFQFNESWVILRYKE